jgi:tellurite resistance protein TerC
MLSNELIFFSLFIAFILLMLALDLGVLGKRNHIISFKEAGLWSAVWVACALTFYLLLDQRGELVHGIDSVQTMEAVRHRYARHLHLTGFTLEDQLQQYRDNMSLEFITGYLVEYALSVDNIFVIILIFSSFKVREMYFKKVLFWGIMGAIVMRFCFIFLGSALMQRFEWILYVFGAFLVFTGARMFFSQDDGDEPMDTQNHPVVKLAAKYFNVFPRYVRDRFFLRREGKFFITPLFVVLLIIEFTDLIFAVDSVPAVFAVTKDPYIVFFSNIFAILGLRSMFFFLTNIMHLFHYLKLGLAVLLVFIGGKMLAHSWLKSLGFQTQHSLYVILGILFLSIVLSLVFPQKQKELVA